MGFRVTPPPRRAIFFPPLTHLCWDYPPTITTNILQDSYVKFEGTMGAIHIRLGLALDYPRGAPDEFRYILVDGAGGDGGPCGSGAWQTLHVGGSWFPEAFIGTMASLMRYANGETDALPTSVDDAYVTMAVVEAAYQSSQQGGTAIPH